jgi:hypothetical protein
LPGVDSTNFSIPFNGRNATHFFNFFLTQLFHIFLRRRLVFYSGKKSEFAARQLPAAFYFFIFCWFLLASFQGAVCQRCFNCTTFLPQAGWPDEFVKIHPKNVGR